MDMSSQPEPLTILNPKVLQCKQFCKMNYLGLTKNTRLDMPRKKKRTPVAFIPFLVFNNYLRIITLIYMRPFTIFLLIYFILTLSMRESNVFYIYITHGILPCIKSFCTILKILLRYLLNIDTHLNNLSGEYGFNIRFLNSILRQAWSSVHVYSNVHWTSQFLQGTRKTRPC